MGFFPGIVSKLDALLAIFALIAAPVGAVVLLDVYLFPKIKLQQNFSFENNGPFNIAAAATWLISMVACYFLYIWLKVDFFFFMAIPGWFIAALIYVPLSWWMQKRIVVNHISTSIK